jgi:hypothetical protein
VFYAKLVLESISYVQKKKTKKCVELPRNHRKDYIDLYLSKDFEKFKNITKRKIVKNNKEKIEALQDLLKKSTYFLTLQPRAVSSSKLYLLLYTPSTIFGPYIAENLPLKDD